MASAWTMSSFPRRYARLVNSPASAGRAPARTQASTMAAGVSHPPWQLISTTSSPVKLAGASYRITTVRSRIDPSSGSTSSRSTATRAAGRASSGRESAWRMGAASGPDNRTMATAPTPGGVACATMVSTSILPHGGCGTDPFAPSLSRGRPGSKAGPPACARARGRSRSAGAASRCWPSRSRDSDRWRDS